MRDAAIFPLINRANYAPTIYPPAAQAIFLTLTRLGESVLVMKLGLLACEAATMAAIVALLQRQGMPPTRVAVYAWHPLPIWEIAGNGHVDAAMIALLMAALLLFVRGRTILAGVAATLGALVKPAALLALPVFWRPWDWRLPLAVALTVVLAYLPYLSVGAGVLGFLPAYLQEEGFASGSGSGFKLLWLAEQVDGPAAPRRHALYGPRCSDVDRACAGCGLSLRPLGGGLDALAQLAADRVPGALVPALSLVFPGPRAVPGARPSDHGLGADAGGVLFYDVLSSDVLPSYDTRITVFTLATLAALAHDLWSGRRRAIAAPVGETP